MILDFEDCTSEFGLNVSLYEFQHLIAALASMRMSFKKALLGGDNPLKIDDETIEQSLFIINNIGQKLLNAAEKLCKEENNDFPIEEYRKKWEED